MAYFELQVPQRMQDCFDRVLVNDFLKEKKQVDVGLRVNGCTAISSNGQQCERIRAIAVTPEVADNFVHLVTDDGFDANMRRVGKEFRFEIVYKGFQLRASRRFHRTPS